ncbi:MAG: hypothetical protein M3198_03305, partial [Actinomycetota bacterium]|nr:hypothetical protein [Actinomycetota bacterium]
MARLETRGIALGVYAATISALLLLVLPVAIGVALLGLVTVVAYAAYPFLALKRGQRHLLVGEAAFLLLGIVFAVLGVVKNPAWIAVGLAIHGAVDLAHEHPLDFLVGRTPRWYTRF